MLQKVILENFQAHEHSEIEFSEGINVISGASDQGKSSVIRAIRWVLENRPSGFAFKREGAEGPTRVTLVFDKGTIVKERSATENCYKVYKDGKKSPIVLKALRSDVPEEVKEISGFGSYNIQYQFGNSFLLDDSGGEVANKINDLSGVSVIDDILKETNSRIRTENAKEKSIKELLVKLQKSKDAFKNLKHAEKLFKKATGFHTEIEEYEYNRKSLSVLVKNLILLEETPTVDTDKIEKIISELQEDVDSYKEFIDVRGILADHLNNLATAETELKKYENTEEAEEHIKDALRALPKLTELQNRASSLKDKLAKLETCTEGWKQSVREAKKAIDDLAIFKKEHKVCPVCSKKW